MAFDSFRGFDLTGKKKKIENAFNRVPPKSADDVPVILNTPCYFGSGTIMPQGYWDDPKVMLDYQQEGAHQHLMMVDDDAIPYFMPWFGTGVLASAFGCPMRDAQGNGDDPAVIGHLLNRPADIAHVKRPDIRTAGWMPRVIKFMEYAARYGEIPVGATDLNSPFSTVAQICGYENLFFWMYDEPQAVHELMSLVCETFTDWVKLQRQISGEADGMSNGLQGLWTPRGGVWLSDDDLVSINAELYEEFVLPYYINIFETFGGGHLHWCGLGNQHIGNILKMHTATAINNSPMGNFAAFKKLYDALHDRFVLEIQTGASDDPERYFGGMFEGIDDFTGLLVAGFATSPSNKEEEGLVIKRDAAKLANDSVAAIRAVIGKNMK